MNKEIDVSKIILKTERLVLRPFKFSDLDDLYEYARVPGVGEAAGWSHHKDISESKSILSDFINGNKTLAITLNNKVIGSIGIERYNSDYLTEFDEFLGRELGFVLSKDYWGMGIMSEALKCVINYLFHEEKLDFLICGHFDENYRSKRVQEKLGFKPYKKVLYNNLNENGTKKSGVINILINNEQVSFI